jgi:hypothetical protein
MAGISNHPLNETETNLPENWRIEKQQAHFSTNVQRISGKATPENLTWETWQAGTTARGIEIQSQAEPARTVVDLHIEKLTDIRKIYQT